MELAWRQSLFLCVTLGLVLTVHTSAYMEWSEYTPMSPNRVSEKFATPIAMAGEAQWIMAPLGLMWTISCLLFAMGEDLGSGDDAFQSRVVNMMSTINLLATGYIVCQSKCIFAAAWVFLALKLTVLYKLYAMLEAVLETPLIKFDKWFLLTVSATYYFAMFELATETADVVPVELLGFGGCYIILGVVTAGAVEQTYMYKDPVGLVVIAYSLLAVYGFQIAFEEQVAIYSGGSLVADESLSGMFDL